MKPGAGLDRRVNSRRVSLGGVPVRLFKRKEAWAAWLDEQHGRSSGVWLRLAKKASGAESVSYTEALEVALCYGWIDGQKRSESEYTWLQKFTPRSKRSIWSKINRRRALALIKSGRMHRGGLKEIERAKRDGRWAAAYDSPRTAAVPGDFRAALDRNARAKASFAALDGRNRYAVLFRIHTAKKAETRSARIRLFIQMLEKNEKLHP